MHLLELDIMIVNDKTRCRHFRYPIQASGVNDCVQTITGISTPCFITSITIYNLAQKNRYTFRAVATAVLNWMPKSKDNFENCKIIAKKKLYYLPKKASANNVLWQVWLTELWLNISNPILH